MSRLAPTDFCGLLGKSASTVPSHGDQNSHPSAPRATATLPSPAAAAATPRPAAAPFSSGVRENSATELSRVPPRPGATPPPETARDKTWVEGHPRKLPEPPTLEIILHEFRMHENRPLALGRFCADWLAQQPDRPADAQLTRSDALRHIRAGLVAQQQVGMAGRVDRFLASYYVARELGWQAAWKLRYSAVRELLPLFGRNAAQETYELRPTKAAATRVLWQRMVAEHLTAHQVREEVRRLMPRRTLALHGAAGRLAALRRELARLKSREDLLAVIRLAEERLARLGLADQAKAG